MEAQVLGGLRDSRLFGRVSVCIHSQYKMKDERNQLIHIAVDCEHLLCLLPGGNYWHNKRLLTRKIIFLFIYFPHIVKSLYCYLVLLLCACCN